MNFQKELEKINISNAIKGRPFSNLDGILRNLDPEDLLLTASQYAIRKEGFIVRKDRLIKKLSDYILRGQRIEEILAVTKPGEYDLFLKLLDREYIQDNFLAYGTYGHLFDNGLIYSFHDRGKVFFTVPHEIKEVYRSMDIELFEDILKENQLIYKYILSFTNLYGVFSKELLIAVYNSQNKGNLTLDDFEAVLDMHLSRQQPFYELDEFILDQYFDRDNLDEMEKILEGIEELTYYIPEKKDLLKYADDNYFEITPQLKKLKTFIINKMGINEELAGYLIDDIQMICSMDYSLQDVVYEFESRGIYFKSMEQFNSALPLIEDVYKNARTWSNLGHTYIEIYNITGKKPSNIFNEPVEIMINSKRHIRKVKRNDLCPCGSGKKYKKCCEE